MKNQLLLCWLIVVASIGMHKLQAQVLAKETEKKTLIVRTITGTVTDENQAGLPGVSVSLENTTIGTSTDTRGMYQLEVPDEGGTLIFSFIGYNSEKVSIGSQSQINVTMVPDIKSLSEVVVVGYGTQKKSDLTGSLSTIKAADIAAYPVAGAVQALQGRATGVQVQSTNGEPGAPFRIRVRGGSSINASGDPLFVVDGFIGGVLPAPEDIASVEVLKDASATAIYGARGANGVVIVTTKSGKSGEFRIDFNASYTSQEVIGRINVLNATDYNKYRAELAPATPYVPLGTENTNWQDQIFRSGGIQNYQLGLSGGNEKVRYYVSGAYYDQKGTIITSQFKRYNFLTNLNIKATERLNLGVNISASRSDQEGVRSQESGGGRDGGGLVSGSYLFAPTLGVFIADGVTYSKLASATDNPVAVAKLRNRQAVSDRVQVNTSADFKVFEGLVFKTTNGVTGEATRIGDFQGSTLIPSNGSALASVENIKRITLLTENYFQYSKTFNGKHDVGALVGYSYQSFNSEANKLTGAGFPNDDVLYWSLGSASSYSNVNNSTYSRLSNSQISSFYTRLNYGFGGRYLFTVTARYDGSSVFAPGKQWAFFPSGAFAWNVSKESFMQNIKFISDLKIRTSYGVTGNQSIDAYQTLASVNSTSQNGVVTFQQDRSPNKDLKWEITRQFNVGIDVAVLEGRLGLTADYYDKQTSDLLFARTLSATTGFRSRLENIGAIENKGFEFALNSKNLVGDFKWSTGLNISFNRNKVVALPDNNADIVLSANPSQMQGMTGGGILRVGQPVGSFYGLLYDGVLQSGETPLASAETGPGAEKYKDVNGDGGINDLDRVIIGNPNPDYIFGVNNDLSYKGFDLNVFIQGSVGNDVLNYTRAELETLNGNDLINTTKRRL
jgi:TonB-dependent starch-binding outer membrane protein SusC